MPAPKYFANADAFGAWLATNAEHETELLVGFHKVGSGRPCMTWSESVDEALCHGWIDGVRKRVDDDRYTIRFSPRQPTSVWSAINIMKVEKLKAEGRMHPAGLRAVAARQDCKSRIYAYEQRETAALSAAEVRAFKRHRAAWTYFEATPPGYRKTIVYWVTQAKRAETRASRLATLVAACAEGRRLR